MGTQFNLTDIGVSALESAARAFCEKGRNALLRSQDDVDADVVTFAGNASKIAFSQFSDGEETRKSMGANASGV